MIRWTAGLALLVVGLLAGWILASALPLPLWPYSDCHRLGGAIHAAEGAGKPTECVIPWKDN